MRAPHAIVLVGLLALIGFLAWLSTIAKDPTIYVGLVGLLVIGALIGFFAWRTRQRVPLRLPTLR